MPRKKIKTKKSQLDAIQRYNARHDRITLTLPAGTKDKIAEITDKSINRYISDLICVSLDNCNGTELNRIDEDKTIYTDTDNTNNIDTDTGTYTNTDTDMNTNTDIEKYTTVTTDTGTIVSTEQNNVMDLFD